MEDRGMTLSVKMAVGVVAVLVAGGGVYAAVGLRRADGLVVVTEHVQRRHLEAVVSASGKIQAKRAVNISADTMGRVTTLAVEEGDRVKKGDFLIQIDARNLQAAVTRSEASMRAAESQGEQYRV